MRSKSKTTFLATATLWLSAVFLWPGCALVPLPSSRTPIAARKKQDFAFIKAGKTTHSEIVEKLGKPDQEFYDLKVACYRINKVTARSTWVLLVFPMGVEEEQGGVDVAFIQFDEQDRVRRSGLKKVLEIERAQYSQSGWKTLHEAAQDWLTQKKK